MYDPCVYGGMKVTRSKENTVCFILVRQRGQPSALLLVGAPPNGLSWNSYNSKFVNIVTWQPPLPQAYTYCHAHRHMILQINLNYKTVLYLGYKNLRSLSLKNVFIHFS